MVARGVYWVPTIMVEFADAIGVAGDPLVDIGELEKVQFVMEAGVVYRNAR